MTESQHEIWNPFERTLGVFGESGLARASIAGVRNLRIPESSKSFLVTVGLPIEPVLLCRFDLSGIPIPTLNEYLNQMGSGCVHESMRRIGTDSRMEICIQEGSSGQVVALDPEGAIPPRLVNSSIEAFGGFLSLYVEYGRRCQRCTGEEADAIAQDYDRLMRKIDPAAFAPLDSWWGLVTEQMKDGLL